MKVAKVQWVDSCVSDFGWQLMEDVPEVRPIEIFTFGCVTQETEDSITIAQNYGLNPSQCCSLITIQKGCIKSITILEVIKTEDEGEKFR